MNGRECGKSLKKCTSPQESGQTKTKQIRTSIPVRSASQQRRKRIEAEKRRARRLKATVIGTATSVILIIIVALVCKSCVLNRKLAEFKGKWRYDEYTEYEFDGKGNGCLCLDGTTHYTFTYSVSSGTLKIDFIQQYVTDCEYTYTAESARLILVGGKGTAEPGKTYELIKETQENDREKR